MSRHPFFVALACIALAACSRSAPVTQTRPTTGGDSAAAPQRVTLTGDYVVAAPIQQGNLTIFPILSKTPRLDDRFVTLEEGLKAGTVQIQEVGAGATLVGRAQIAEQGAEDRPEVDSQEDVAIVASETASAAENLIQNFSGNDVNRLTVINLGDKPLYLMPGEIIIGGSQDRTIAEEMVIAATGEPVKIDVYCVEHGRWGIRDVTANSAILSEVAAELAGDEKVADDANRGKFVAKAGTLSKNSRLAVAAAEGQEKVWDEVASANAASGRSWTSGAFTANYVDQDVIKRLKPFTEALSSPVADQEHVVGIVVAINGKIETVDVFESTPLFRKLWPQLLKSFALDALQSHLSDADAAKKVATSREAEEFLAAVLRDQEGDSRKTGGGLVVSRRETPDAISFSASGMMGGMGAEMSPKLYPVHASGFARNEKSTRESAPPVAAPTPVPTASESDVEP